MTDHNVVNGQELTGAKVSARDQDLVGKVIELFQNQESLSRNKSLDLFLQSDDWRAMRYFKLLKSLENEVLSAGHELLVKVRPIGDDRIEVRVENPLLRYTRSCFLPAALFSCLAQRLKSRGMTIELALP